MVTDHKAPLCRYVYDATDRLAMRALDGALSNTNVFYVGQFLTTEIHSVFNFSFFRYSESLLAQCKRTIDASEVSLLSVDRQNSIVKISSPQKSENLTYTAYGYHPQKHNPMTLLGFIGEHKDAVTGCYLLGNGHRMYNTSLMRFSSPDSLSPFGKGDLNSYAYCKGDSINFQDNNGRMIINSLASVMMPFIKPIKTSSAASLAVDALHDASKVSSKALPVPPPGYYLAGYHGSKSKHIANTVKSGLDSDYIGHSVGTSYGPGYYITPNIRAARAYSKPSQRFNGIGFKRPNSVAAVFVKDLPSKVDGVDFSYFSRNGLVPEQLMIRQSMYKDVIVMPLNSFKYARRPVDHPVFKRRLWW